MKTLTRTNRQALMKVGRAELDRQLRLKTALGGVSAREQTGYLYCTRISDAHNSRGRSRSKGTKGAFESNGIRITAKQAAELAEAGLVKIGETERHSAVEYHAVDGWGWAITTYSTPLCLTDAGREELGLAIPRDQSWEGIQTYRQINT
jgi:hypothetical protein